MTGFIVSYVHFRHAYGGGGRETTLVRPRGPDSKDGHTCKKCLSKMPFGLQTAQKIINAVPEWNVKEHGAE